MYPGEVSVRRPDLRKRHDPPPDIDWVQLAARVSYSGSPEHKTHDSPAGRPAPRADATKCDPTLTAQWDLVQSWLRAGIRARCVSGPWEGDDPAFPRYVYCKVDNVVYQARLTNRVIGQYKGWQLEPDEWPDCVYEVDWNREDLW